MRLDEESDDGTDTGEQASGVEGRGSTLVWDNRGAGWDTSAVGGRWLVGRGRCRWHHWEMLAESLNCTPWKNVLEPEADGLLGIMLADGIIEAAGLE